MCGIEGGKKIAVLIGMAIKITPGLAGDMKQKI